MASKTRSQGREGWSVIFRHPVRIDPNTGKAGLRVRRGLGTSVDTDADRLVGELNELLRSPEYWNTSSKSLAEERFDQRVVTIFFDGVDTAPPDYRAIRDEALPLPSKDDDYRRVLLLGTTGAGKTTLVRQFIGTDPKTERFPSISTAKTTVADTEIILAEGPYRAVVTFAGMDEIIDALTDCVSEAGLAANRGASDSQIAQHLLDHPNQRFRFSYVLGRGSWGGNENEEEPDDDDDDGELDDTGDPDPLDQRATADLIVRLVADVRALTSEHAARVKEELLTDERDERVIAEIIEENLDAELRRDERFHAVVDALHDEIEKRFVILEGEGALERSRQRWPLRWTWETADRNEFVKVIQRFSSNHARAFGRLLTPLVNGLRVSGPFRPAWANSTETPRLVFIDGEGLGHSPHSAAVLPTKLSNALDEVDAVLLVDNATQPMQAAPVAAVKGVVTSGNASKLLFGFTHFDDVRGDNLPTFAAREQHVLASVENVIKAIGDELGPFAERALRARLETASFFLSAIQGRLDEGKRAGRRTIQQLSDLLGAVERIGELPEQVTARPVYDRMNLVLAVSEAARDFHQVWRGLLGLEFNPAAPKEHWTRIKALSRRLAEGWADEYSSLKPVAHLRQELQSQIYLMLQRPLEWQGGAEPTTDEKQQVIDEFSQAVARRLSDLATRRLRDERREGWQSAYALYGRGSTFERANIIAEEVYEKGAPIPSVAATPDQNIFLHQVADVVDSTANELNVTLR